MNRATIIITELEAIRARRAGLDRLTLCRDLTDDEDAEWAALDQREGDLTAEMRDFIEATTGLFIAQIKGVFT